MSAGSRSRRQRATAITLAASSKSTDCRETALLMRGIKESLGYTAANDKGRPRQQKTERKQRTGARAARAGNRGGRGARDGRQTRSSFRAGARADRQPPRARGGE